MADNTTLNKGFGGDVIATDEIAGVKYQRVKVVYGADGEATDASSANPLPTTDLPELAASGDVSTLKAWNRYGQNPDIDSGAAEDIWSNGGLWMDREVNATAETFDVVSDDANDLASTGTGARTVELFGLDGNYDEQTETINMNGTTSVATANTYIVLYRTRIMSTGSGGANAGNISSTGQTSGNVHSRAPAGNNQSLQATHCVPDNKTGFLYDYYVAVQGGTSADVEFALKIYDVDNYPQWTTAHRISVGSGQAEQVRFRAPIKLPGKTFVLLEATSDTNNVKVYGGFTLVVDG